MKTSLSRHLRSYLTAACCAALAASCGGPPTSTHLVDEPRQQAEQQLSTSAGNFVDSSGHSVALHGFNYFGFNNGQTMVDGLWGGPAVGLDFATIVYRQQLLGFNAVRLPFSFKDLLNLKPRNFTQGCTLPSQKEVAQSVLSSGQSLPATIPAQAYKPTRKTGQCNEYLPNDTVWNRYKWVVKFYAHNGFYVLIDNHLREDTTALDDSNRWAQLFAQLVGELVVDPVVRDHLLIDVLNEPDNYGLRWEAQGGKPGLADLYLKAMDSINRVAPKSVFCIEGTGQGSLQANWGDGYATGAQDISSLGLSDPRPFFQKLRSKPYRNRVALAPHIYGPAVSTNRNASSGSGFFNRLSKSFGTLTSQGYCYNGTCDRYAVAVGEFGSHFTDAGDIAAMNDLSLYLRNTGAGKDGKHQAINNWFYWSWNPNSGDTGGLVKDDWVSLQAGKISFLKTLGLKPFSR